MATHSRTKNSLTKVALFLAIGDQVLGPETQYWAYGARTTGVDAVDADGQRNREMLSDKVRQSHDTARQSLIEQAAHQRVGDARL